MGYSILFYLKGVLIMKKLISTIVCCIIFAATLLPITAFAWETPELDLDISYNEKKKEITVEYIVNNFAGTESADFRLKYNPDVVEFKEHKAAKIDNTFIEIDEMPSENGKIAIQFVDIYYVQPEDCEEDGSATVATLTFSVIDESATEAVFIATADSCAMDPDSEEVSLNRYTEKFLLSETEQTSDIQNASSDNSNITKIIIAAVVTLIVLVGGTVAIVIKYRKN